MRNPFAAKTTTMPVNTGFNDMMDDTCEFCTLTKKQRVYGWLMCFIIGFILSILSTISLLSLNITGFAVLYTLGNILALCSTGFLIGPMRQLKTMFSKVRAVATIVYLVTLVATLVVAFSLKTFLLTLILCIVQFCALFWYSASYVPYGRKLIRKTLGSMV